jgi:hypothetical protein
MGYMEAALFVLKRFRRPMHYEQMAKVASRLVTNGARNYQVRTMAVILAQEVARGDAARVSRVRPGVYRLRNHETTTERT